MSLNKEGFKMDPKLAETMERIEAEHPPAPTAPVVEVVPSEKKKKKYIDPDAMAHDLYHRMRQTDP